MGKKELMTRAWAIFRRTYNYPAIPFKSIGVASFAYALRRAWAEAKHAARVDAIPVNVKAERSTALRRELELLPYRGDFRAASLRGQEIETQLGVLAA